MGRLEFRRDGAQRIEGAGLDSLEQLDSLSSQSTPRAGERLLSVPGLKSLFDSSSMIERLVNDLAGAGHQPVRALLFDKSPDNNWALGWHQDRVIAVRARADAPGFDRWTVKGGVPHVAPPGRLLERMVAVRVHLDDVRADNAPLLVAPGSHRLGIIRESEIDAVVARLGKARCLAGRGDIWIYSTLILHASERSPGLGRRRVVQVDFSPDTLPGSLGWAGLQGP